MIPVTDLGHGAAGLGPVLPQVSVTASLKGLGIMDNYAPYRRPSSRARRGTVQTEPSRARNR